ncbi:M67 family metallopeptidase [Bacillus sp. BHET2]|uniref:M67 family metallopeptidase n=1 Tax=Bacillus sp. BHET2 TaxID=2583818 RepID=UPI0014868DD0|nr:M67 family metallopeptidase [Bacillus sp. BHET2]TMU87710.1 M67 family metallopeptidase [Bacillus sp. BHET2]
MSKRVYMRIMLEVRKGLPNEACGFISGKNNHCLTTWPMTNTDPSPYSFAIDLDEQDWVIKNMLKKNESFLGIYHSHPFGIPVPSRDDVAYSQYPELFYFIAAIGGRKEELRCYKINNGKVRHIEIVVQ